MRTEIKASRDYGNPSARQKVHHFIAPLRVHRLNWLTLLLGFALLTGISAWRYYELSMTKGLDQISSKCAEKPSIPLRECVAGESLYFSIATETTVGYGDLSPKGWARVVACLQALLGLMLAGLFLGKIASLPTRATRQIIEKCTGYWIEFSETRQQTMISFVTISYKDSLVHYCGDNYRSDGVRLKNFNGHIEIANFHQGSKVAFWYTNEEDFDDFYEGTTTLRFVEENAFAKRFTRFSGFANDTKWKKIRMCGYRVLKRDETRFRSKDNDVRTELLFEYLDRYENDPTSEVQKVRSERRKRAVQPPPAQQQR